MQAEKEIREKLAEVKQRSTGTIPTHDGCLRHEDIVWFHDTIEELLELSAQRLETIKNLARDNRNLAEKLTGALEKADDFEKALKDAESEYALKEEAWETRAKADTEDIKKLEKKLEQMRIKTQRVQAQVADLDVYIQELKRGKVKS